MPEKRERRAGAKHDAAYRNIFANRRSVADTLRGAVREVAGGLDFSTLERLPASFVTEHLGQRHADMLWRVRFAGGGWLYLVVLLEFQSTIDRRMALRMMDYTVRVLQGLGRDALGPGGEFPFVLPMVVYSGKRRWNAARDIGDLFPRAPKGLVGHVPRHRYLLIELRTLDVMTYPPDNVLALIARLERADSGERLGELAVALERWLGEPELRESLSIWITLVLAQRFQSRDRQLAIETMRKEGAEMSTLLERARRWGEEERQQARKQGMEQGMERGRIAGERGLVRRLIRRRHGPELADRLVPLLDQLSDPERIAAVADAVIDCDTAEEVMVRAREASRGVT